MVPILFLNKRISLTCFNYDKQHLLHFLFASGNLIQGLLGGGLGDDDSDDDGISSGPSTSRQPLAAEELD